MHENYNNGNVIACNAEKTSKRRLCGVDIIEECQGLNKTFCNNNFAQTRRAFTGCYNLQALLRVMEKIRTSAKPCACPKPGVIFVVCCLPYLFKLYYAYTSAFVFPIIL